VASRGQLELALARYDARQSSTHIALFSQDPKVVCLCRLALTQWCLGDWEPALQNSQAALVLARQLGHPFTHVYAAHIDALMQSLRRAAQATKLRAEELIGLSRQHRLGHFLPLSLAQHGWALAEQGMFEAGVTEQQEGMAAALAGGNEYLLPYFRAILAEQYGRAGEGERGLALAAAALALLEKTGERWCEAEVYRLHAELLLAAGQAVAGEAALARAVAVARAQQARSFELRASVSLAHLWHRQAKFAQAQRLLAPIYRSFSPQLDSPDLCEAGSLLAALEAQISP
jgi:predicted ATPase